MSKGNTTENDLVKFIFNKTNPAWAENVNFYVSLHTADPEEDGNQASHEADYTGYNRVAVARTAGGWTIDGAQASNTAEITFPQCVGGSNAVTHVGIGLSAYPTAGQLIYSGALNNSLSVSNLITPRIIAGALIITEG